MTRKARLSLEEAISEWIDEMVESHESSVVFYYHPELVEHMTGAAEIVFDTMVASSAYTILETAE